MLFHELDDYTMTEAMKWYPKLKESFDVRVRFDRVFFCANAFRLLAWENSTSYLLASPITSLVLTLKITSPSPTSSNVCYVHTKAFPERSC
jgi:hypothetical protein